MKIAEILQQPWGSTIDCVAGKVIALYPVKGGTGFSLQNAKICDETGRQIDVMFSSFPSYWDIGTFKNGFVEIRGVPGAPLVWKEQFKNGESLKKAKLEVTVVAKEGATHTPLVKMFTPAQAAAAARGAQELDFGSTQPSAASSAASPMPHTANTPVSAPIVFPFSSPQKKQGVASSVTDELRKLVLLHRMVVELVKAEPIIDGVTLESTIGLVYVQATREGLHHKLDLPDASDGKEPARPHLAKLAELIRGHEDRAEGFLRLAGALKADQSWRDMDEVAAERACTEVPKFIQLLAS